MLFALTGRVERNLKGRSPKNKKTATAEGLPLIISSRESDQKVKRTRKTS